MPSCECSIAFGRKHGVTCHYMDDGIDTGDIIEQIEIPITNDVSLDLLYKLSFIMEGYVFEQAIKNNFNVKNQIDKRINTIYYTRKNEDYYIKKDDSEQMILRRVRAFSSQGQYAKINIEGQVINIKSVKIITNSMVKKLYDGVENYKVCVTYGECILIKIHGDFLELETVNYDLKNLSMLENKKML